jgi:hypothetical protein
MQGLWFGLRYDHSATNRDRRGSRRWSLLLLIRMICWKTFLFQDCFWIFSGMSSSGFCVFYALILTVASCFCDICDFLVSKVHGGLRRERLCWSDSPDVLQEPSASCFVIFDFWRSLDMCFYHMFSECSGPIVHIHLGISPECDIRECDNK